MALVSCKSQNKFPSVTAAEAALWRSFLFPSKHLTVKWIVSGCAVLQTSQEYLLTWEGRKVKSSQKELAFFLPLLGNPGSVTDSLGTCLGCWGHRRDAVEGNERFSIIILAENPWQATLHLWKWEP